jgi:translocation and assembly module TamA
LTQFIRLSLFLIVCSCSFADDNLHALTYTFNITGLENASIEKRFNGASTLKTYKDTPLFSIQNLNKRITDDYNLLLQLLKSKGFYDAEVKLINHHQNYRTDIVFQVTAGPRYKLKTITIELGNAHDEVLKEYPYLFEELPIQVGQYVSAEKIYHAFGIIIQKFNNCGYPYAKIKDHSAQLLKEKRRIILIIEVDPGPRMRFGDIQVESQVDVPASYIKNRVPWNKGDIFDARKIDRYREKLSRTRLFDSAVIDYPQQAESGEEVPMVVTVTERKARTLSAGLSYSVNEGFGGSVGWIHRNLTSQGDKLNPRISYSQITSKFELDYEKPDFIWAKTALTPSVAVTYEDTESYKSESAGGSVVLRTEFAENSEYFYGVSFDHDRAKQEGKTMKGNLLGTPLGIKYDHRDDLFDPTKGYIVNGTFTPKIGRIGDANFMTKTIVSGSYYYAIAPKIILAGWGRAGSIAGINLSDVVANNRFYAGGGGSIRGYGYQMAGPLDKKGKPTGGKSLLEGGLELRLRVLNDWGAAVFLEGGHVDRHTVPNLKKDLLFGAGLGVRYFTDFGPIRVDLATPLKRRKKENGSKVDRVLEFYISIGQGF